MITIELSALQKLDSAGRLLNATLKGPTGTPGRFGFRGDIALKFQTQLADEKRPPEYSIEQVLTLTEGAEPTLPVLAGYLHSLAYLETAREVLDGLLTPDGVYILFVNNVDLLAKYKVELDGIPFIILPLDESTVWKEMMELTNVDRNDIKKLDSGAKLDRLLDEALKFRADYRTIDYQTGLAQMGPVRNRNENRPV